MTRRSIDIFVGLFVLLGLAALAFMALKAANLGTVTGVSTYSVMARFDNIGGLKVRAPVKSAGVVVGRVGDIAFDMKRYQADVRIDMDDRYRFPADSSVKILTSGLLGEQYLGIEAGADEKVLGGGDRITMTQSAVVLENLIGQFLYGKAAEGADTEGKGNAQK
ncbi:MAG: outer membrane lipid asymmetry maintenance protein MlaD [Lautropia sp.]